MAQIRLATSLSNISRRMTAYWSFVPGSTFNRKRSGIMGSCAMSHLTQPGSISPGSHSVTRWPMAQVTMYSSPVRKPSPLPFTPSTRAMSRATDGFSATISFFDMVLSLILCGYRSHFIRSRRFFQPAAMSSEGGALNVKL